MPSRVPPGSHGHHQFGNSHLRHGRVTSRPNLAISSGPKHTLSYTQHVSHASVKTSCLADQQPDAAVAVAQPKAKRRPKPFQFRHFELRHDECAMKMGTDAMLLGSWARPDPETRYILDIGTGSGVLALMLAQRSHHDTRIHAIDVDAAACRQAAGNAATSPWAAQVQVFMAGLGELVDCLEDQPPTGAPAGRPLGGQNTAVMSASDWCPPPVGYDLIISNPPYFINSYLPQAGSVEGTVNGESIASSTSALLSATSQEPLLPSLQPTNQMQSHSSGPTEAGLGLISVKDTACKGGKDITNTTATAAGYEAQTTAQVTRSHAGHTSAEGADISVAGGVAPAGVHQRVLARHAGAADGQALTYEVLAEGAGQLLRPGGVLYVVLPVDQGEADRFAELAKEKGMRLERCLHVYSTSDATSEKRRLMKFLRDGHRHTAVGKASHTSHEIATSPLHVAAHEQAPGNLHEGALGGSLDGADAASFAAAASINAAIGMDPVATRDASGSSTLNEHDKQVRQDSMDVVKRDRLVLVQGCEGPKAVYTHEYIRLTWDYHHPMFFKSMGYEGTVPP